MLDIYTVEKALKNVTDLLFLNENNESYCLSLIDA
jgi:hypothetical protein